jgi:hypothetical protein
MDGVRVEARYRDVSPQPPEHRRPGTLLLRDRRARYFTSSDTGATQSLCPVLASVR